MNFIRRIVFIIFILFSAFSSFAVHIKGGWMYYEWVSSGGGSSTYRVIVKVYRDCAVPNPGQNDANITISIFDNNARSQVKPSISASQTRMYNLQKQSFSNCINPVPNVCYVVLEYTGTVTLPDVPGGYTLAFQRCCRIGGIANVTQPSNNFGNTYTITIPGTGTSPDYVINSSPKFVEKDTVAICYNSPFILDYGATDPDGDSLVYSFTSALNGGSPQDPVPVDASFPPYSSIPYSSIYSANAPFGTGTTINSKTGLISGISPAITGEYVVAVSIKEFRNGILIAETRKELHVNVAPCSMVTAVLPARIINCDGYTVTFENQSTSPSINSYYWDFGDTKITTDTSTQARPTYTYADTGVYIAKLVVNRNANCSDSTTTEVRVFPGFFPDFTWNGSCFSNPFQFVDQSSTRYGFINFHRWNFGDPQTTADTSRIANPLYQFPQPGKYQVTMEVASNKGCSDTLTKEVEVLDKPLLQLPFKDTLICSIDSLKLIAIGTGVFSWTPTVRMINANTATPIVFPLVTTTYTVNLNDRGCVATDTVRVNVLDFITVDAGPDTTICRTDAITLKPVSQGLSFSWSPATGLSNASIKNPVASPVAPVTTYRVIANLGKCQSTDDITIRTVPYPIVNAGPDTSICFGDTAMLRGTTDGSAYQWIPSSYLGNPAALQTIAFPPQSVNYTLRVTDTLGCPKPSFDTVHVNVVPPIKVFAGNDTNLVIGQPLQLTGVANASNFTWSPGFGLNNPNISNPILTIAPNSLPDSDEYLKYILTVSSPEGCQSSDELIVRIFRTPPSIFIPSAFTPNADGNNDVFRPILAGIQKLIYFRVYNRYGQLVFETSEVGRGWDGKVKGQPQSSSAFVYNCQAIDFNGRLVKLQGTFVLIR